MNTCDRVMEIYNKELKKIVDVSVVLKCPCWMNKIQELEQENEKN